MPTMPQAIPQALPQPSDRVAPPVHLEACMGFVADADGGPCCAECGWSADDHDVLVGAQR